MREATEKATHAVALLKDAVARLNDFEQMYERMREKMVAYNNSQFTLFGMEGMLDQLLERKERADD